MLVVFKPGSSKRNKKLLVRGALLVVTGATLVTSAFSNLGVLVTRKLVVTRSY